MDEDRVYIVLLRIERDLGELVEGQKVANGRLANHDVLIADLVTKVEDHSEQLKEIETNKLHAQEIEYAKRWPIRLLRGFITSAPVAAVTGVVVKFLT